MMTGAVRKWAARALPGAIVLTGLVAAQARAGDALRGQKLFAGQAGCTACHRAVETGSALGPNLTDIATRLPVEQLRTSLLNHATTVPQAYRRYRVTTRQGKTVVGRLLNQDPYSLQMIDGDGELVGFDRSQVREAGFIDTAAIPSYRETLDANQLADLVAYLATLHGAGV